MHFVKGHNSTKSIPFVLKLIPHLKLGDSSPIDIMTKFISGWPENVPQPHWVVDAGFGNEILSNEISAMGGGITLHQFQKNAWKLFGLDSNVHSRQTHGGQQSIKMVWLLLFIA